MSSHLRRQLHLRPLHQHYLVSGAAVSLQSKPATVSSATASGLITISSESASGIAMAAVAEEDGRSETVQELSSYNEEDIEIPEAEEDAAQRAAETAAARVRVFKARAGSPKSSELAASLSSPWPSSYADVSERSFAPTDPLPVPLPTLPPILVGPATPASLSIVDVDAAAGAF